MVTPIDAVRSGMGFDEAGHWHRARAHYLAAQSREGIEYPLAPARGAIFGLLISAALWIALIEIGKVLVSLM